MHVLMITNDTNFAWNLRREILEKCMQNGYKTTLIAQVLDFKEEFDKLGVNIIDIQNDRRGKNAINDIKLFLKYYNTLRVLKPDIVFTNNIKPNVYAGIACQLLNIKYIANITGLGTPVENPGKLQKLSIFLYRIGVRKATTVFFQNMYNLGFFENNHILSKNSKSVLLPGSGVNLSTHPVLPWENEKVHFLFAARIMKEKGIDYFLDAARSYASPDIIFDVCGQCDDKKYLEILTREKNIIYHGLVKDLLPFYQRCSCFLYPSYYPEGMSNVLLEAAACGRPVIAADRAGCREIVENGITGYIVPVKNKEGVLLAVHKFLTLSNEERRKMGLAGRKKIENEFDRNLVIQAYMEEISNIHNDVL